MKKFVSALCASALLLIPVSGVAFTNTDTGSFDVKVVVNQSCGVSVTPLDFGTYDFGAGNTAPGTLTITCDAASTVTGEVTIDNVGTRAMTNGTDSLTYEIYSDASATVPWDSTPLAWTGPTASFPVNGKLPGGQSVGTGSYVQTLTATINY